MYRNALEPEDIKFLHVVNRQQRRPSALMQDRPTLNFDPENEKSFKIWKQKWDSWLYMVMSEEGFVDSEKIFHFLISCFSDSTMTFVFELGLNDMDARNPDLIIQGLSNLLSAGKNHHYYRFEFHSRVQQPDESFDTWLSSLKALTHFSKFESDCCGKCGDARLLQQIVYGVNKPEVRKLLLEIGPGLSFDQASRIIKKSEYVANELLALNGAEHHFASNNSFNEQPMPTEFQSGQSLNLSDDILIPSSANTNSLDISSEDISAETNANVELSETEASTSQNLNLTDAMIDEEIERNLQIDVKSTNMKQKTEKKKASEKQIKTLVGFFEESQSNCQIEMKSSNKKAQIVQEKTVPKSSELETSVKRAAIEVQEKPGKVVPKHSELETNVKRAPTEIQEKPLKTKESSPKSSEKTTETSQREKVSEKIAVKTVKAVAVAGKSVAENQESHDDGDIKSVIHKKIVKNKMSEIKMAPDETAIANIKTGTKRKSENGKKSAQAKKKAKHSSKMKVQSNEVPVLDATNESFLLNVEVKSEQSNYHCVSCGESFTTFSQRKKHLCGNHNQSVSVEFGVCVICEDRRQLSYMDDFGRCGNCQGNINVKINIYFHVICFEITV
jgi:hypothetical protein